MKGKTLLSALLGVTLLAGTVCAGEMPWITTIGIGMTQFIDFDVVESTPTKAVTGAFYWSGLDFKINVGTQKNPVWRYLRPDSSSGVSTLTTVTATTVQAETVNVTTLLNVDEEVDVDFDAQDEEFVITTSSGGASGRGVLQVINTDTDVTDQHYLLELWHKEWDTDDADTDYIICKSSGDGSATAMTVSQTGDIFTSGDVDIDGNNLDLGDANIDYDGTNYEVDVDTKVHISGAVDLDNTFDGDYVETVAVADGTGYLTFKTSATTSPEGSAEVDAARFEYDWYKGDNQTFTVNGVQGVVRSKGADEAMTARGVYGRIYIDPSYSSTIRTGIGGEFSARASYSGGTDIEAESGTAFVGARIWMAPYFSAGTVSNINNFHGLWIYNEHATVAVTNGIKIESAGGGYTYDLCLQNGETITNSSDDTIAIDAGTVSLTGALTVAKDVTTSSNVAMTFNMADNASEYTITHSSGVGVEGTALITINDDRTGTTANGAAEAALKINAEGTYGLYVEKGGVQIAGTIYACTTSGNLYVGASNGVQLSDAHVKILDNVELKCGSDSDYSIGYSSNDDEIRCVRGSDVTSDATVGWRVTSSTVTAIGDSGTLSFASDSGDLFVEDVLEVDGTLYASFPSDTEANLKTTSPQKAYMLYVDTTNNEIVISTGTGVAQFADSDDLTAAPTGW